MHRRYLPRFVILIAATLLLANCMLVEDFAPQWDKGEIDSCTSKIAESLYYTEFRRDPTGKDFGQLARTMTLGTNHFLMLKMDPADKNGRMYRFGVVNGIFQRYRLNPTARQAFLRDYPKAPVSLKHDTVALANLNDDVTKLLAEIAAKPEYWEIEDQTLYNTMLNPGCKFEDRDLNAIAEKAKQKAAR